MPKILEFESSSVEKAVKKACEELNLDEKELEHDIISYGSTGIFGLVGTKKARIRVVVPEADGAVKKEPMPEIGESATSDETTTVNNSPDQIEYNVTGGNTGVLIGKRGQTLEAMQYLLDKIVNKKSDHRIRLQVDVAGYLENRRLSLKKMAQRMGEKVKKTGKPISVGQMNAHDRRIIHIALKEDDTVWTQSVGDGFYRKLLIFPKKRNGRKQNAS
jgi:spoIIIJ-associated protein